MLGRPRNAWTQSDADFASKLQEGRAWELVIADRLRAHGLRVAVDETGIRRQYGLRHQHRDQDLLVQAASRRWRIAVKSKRVRFGPDPALFPWEDVLVMNRRAWLHLKPRPCAVVIISQVTGCAVVVPASSRREWWPGILDNQREGIRQAVLFCRRQHLRDWDEFVAWLLRRTAGALTAARCS